MLCVAASPARAQKFDLSGKWQAQMTVIACCSTFKPEEEIIRQEGDAIRATKITGDEWVPAGKLNLRGTYTARVFMGQQLCAGPGFSDPNWEDVTITIVDKDHFKVEGGCSGGGSWMREHAPPIS